MFKTEHTYQGFFLIKCALDFKTYDFFKKMMIDELEFTFWLQKYETLSNVYPEKGKFVIISINTVQRLS